jgi:transposase
MRFVGIDIAAETHCVAAVDEEGKVILKPTPFRENSSGYERLQTLLGAPTDTLVAMEATGHYWQNVFAALAADGFAVALLNPIRTNRFSQEELARAKTDEVDALLIARFAAQKKPAATTLPDPALLELRELVRLRDRLVQEFGDKTRQLHRVVDLGFPEFAHIVDDLGSRTATTILKRYPTAEAFRGLPSRRLAGLTYDERHKVGPELAEKILAAAKISVGRHHGEAYRVQVVYACEDLDVLRKRIRTLDKDIERSLAAHKVGTLLTSIDGIGPQTAAQLVAELGDITQFRNSKALASYVGVAPRTWRSGKRNGQASTGGLGKARLRRALYMPTLAAIRCNTWLRPFYLGLRSRGKPAKLAVIACMRKLLSAVYSVAKNERAFVANHALMEAQ